MTGSIERDQSRITVRRRGWEVDEDTGVRSWRLCCSLDKSSGRGGEITEDTRPACRATSPLPAGDTANRDSFIHTTYTHKGAVCLCVHITVCVDWWRCQGVLHGLIEGLAKGGEVQFATLQPLSLYQTHITQFILGLFKKVWDIMYCSRAVPIWYWYRKSFWSQIQTLQ